MKTRPLFLLAVLSAIQFASGPVFGAAADDTGPARCVNVRNIDHTVVVDDQNILFYMKGDRIYQNHLRHPVPGLDRNDPFMYQTFSTQLCRSDTVTVLERWGFGYTARGSGTLNDFVPVNEEEAESLRRGDSSDNGVVTTPVE
ncbi:MAG: hypothetical protein PVH89_12060 [Gammaproteobacteria bacterium]|jgi:hypothetical protein